MKMHKLNSRKCNSIDWSKQEYPRYWDYSGPIAVVKSMTDIKFGSEDWGNDMPKYILGFLSTEVQDEIYEELNSASRGVPVITPWDFLSKSDSDYIKDHFGENGLKEPKYFNIKGKDGKSYFIADIITEDAWKKFISKVPKYAKYKIEEFTPGYASNSRFHKFNSRKCNSTPEIWDPIDVAVTKVFEKSQNRTLENVSLTVQALFAALNQYFPNLGDLKQVFIDAVSGNNQYLNFRSNKSNSRKYNSSSKFWIVSHPDSPTDEGETVWVGPYESMDEAYDRFNESGLKSSYSETEDTYGTNISIMTTEELLPFAKNSMYPGSTLDRMAWDYYKFVRVNKDTYESNNSRSLTQEFID
jgi:hypothetical protein